MQPLQGWKDVYDSAYENVYSLPMSCVFHLPNPSLGFNRLVLCRNFKPTDIHSCSKGANCKFVHADVTHGAKQTVHVNYSWRDLESCKYQRLPAGEVLQVMAPNNRPPVEALPSEMIIVTKGSLSRHERAGNCAPAPGSAASAAATSGDDTSYNGSSATIPISDSGSGAAATSPTTAGQAAAAAATPKSDPGTPAAGQQQSNRPQTLSHCAHYYFNRLCNRGDKCNFIHAVHIDPNAVPNQRAPAPPMVEPLPGKKPTAAAKAHSGQFMSAHGAVASGHPTLAVGGTPLPMATVGGMHHQFVTTPSGSLMGFPHDQGLLTAAHALHPQHHSQSHHTSMSLSGHSGMVPVLQHSPQPFFTATSTPANPVFVLPQGHHIGSYHTAASGMQQQQHQPHAQVGQQQQQQQQQQHSHTPTQQQHSMTPPNTMPNGGFIVPVLSASAGGGGAQQFATTVGRQGHLSAANAPQFLGFPDHSQTFVDWSFNSLVTNNLSTAPHRDVSVSVKSHPSHSSSHSHSHQSRSTNSHDSAPK